ncbi:MAG: hypothetical protein QOH17_2669 [Pseudonocardiales bacterium]|nr:hypothetical protein [Pseudonocardiales bacterium]
MINPAYDVWVWGAAVLFLLLMGARAYVVETGQVRLGRTPTMARALTGAIVVVLVALGGLLAMQGGKLLFSSIVHHTDPSQIPNVVLDPNQPAAPAVVPAPAAPQPAAPQPAAPQPAAPN